ncbi:GntR family transcriptional regulator [Mycolicibacterium celeriflavum]|uniref:Putative HTH-type transcriptional regulator n=1 Tax=Mycolicibacterium celeriflavum TaxID=1249101 RepID=A0A1X0C181_MYCCF|nr:GntR family transcriptional regulator [Mycolicibacterium celeriflavum]MCV7238293.1 GntR family transcriptional regulator [Mycolicibacterium celeriflavum]ORA51022.1 GntR family transcriptional regulator [Mycolicibacterium celeriflavum]BBY44901.1 putative HTH-type transcriptional regulator [Mycolicibacterium celeriflavum]
MPKKYGVKEKDLVVAHVVNLVLTGKLRSGDRIDRNEIAHELGLSRVPIQEAVVQLEHDGILSTRYHRGAFVERFDEDFIREHHELHGFLTGMASARAAAEPDPRIVDRLTMLTELLRSTRESRAFHDAAWQYRSVITDAYAGPRLAALIRSVQAFIPRQFWVAYLSNHDEMLPYYENETAAIGRGDEAAARGACVDRTELMGRIMLAELVRRGVLRAAGASPVAF